MTSHLTAVHDAPTMSSRREPGAYISHARKLVEEKFASPSDLGRCLAVEIGDDSRKPARYGLVEIKSSIVSLGNGMDIQRDVVIATIRKQRSNKSGQKEGSLYYMIPYPGAPSMLPILALYYDTANDQAYSVENAQRIHMDYFVFVREGKDVLETVQIPRELRRGTVFTTSGNRFLKEG